MASVVPSMQKPTITLLAAATAVLGFTVPVSAVAAPTTTTAVMKFNPCGYHPTTTIMLRTGPGAKRTAIGQLTTSDVVYGMKASKAWYKVSLSGDSGNGLRSGTEGWVAKKYLKPETCMQLN
ncbi:SH3 domain-containing protein [Streptomyces sp. NPDC087538]|uniref:SH3 domain-containing protein n=1 Tax=Streptomyces sp. NPDC087538 TaxID=3365797 RepID=UPI0037FA5CCC